VIHKKLGDILKKPIFNDIYADAEITTAKKLRELGLG
jgi:hypothetical protein